MDPDAALARLRAVVEPINRARGRFATVEEREFAEHFTALDEWLSAGNFLPTDWEARRGGDRGTQ